MFYVLDSNKASAATELIHGITVPNLFRETLVSETGVVLVEVCARLDLSGEETSTERSVCDYCDSEVFGCSND